MVSEVAGARLITKVTEKEIKEALWSITPKKMPGLDGFSSDFLRSSWEVMALVLNEA